MGVGLGSLVSIGGGTGSGSGSTSGISSINSQTGPAVSVTGVNGILVTAAGNVITVNAASLSGLIAANPGSGITTINSQTGPTIQVSGINGITVSQPRQNFILIDVSSLSGIIPTSSGIQSVQADSGPHITLDGVNGITISALGNGHILFNTASLSGLIGSAPSGSGITEINSQLGPGVQVSGINGIQVTQPRSNLILIDGASISGTSSSNNGCYTTTFSNVTEQTFTHSLGTKSIIVQIQDTTDEFISADAITATDINNVTIRFNGPQSGRLTVLSCGGGTTSTSGVAKFSASFIGITSGMFTHGFNTRDVLMQIYDTSSPPRQLMPDDIILDTLNAVSLLFNVAQSGRIVIMG